LRASAGNSLVALHSVSELVHLSLQHTIVQDLLRALCSFHSYWCHLSCLGASGLNIVRPLRPLELLVSEDDSESREGQTKDAHDQGGDPVLDLRGLHADVVGSAEQARGKDERNLRWLGLMLWAAVEEMMRMSVSFIAL